MTDFDEFLRKRNEERSAAVRDIDLNFADQGKEWQRLKALVREITQGKCVGEEPFEWSPYPASSPDFLKLSDVAATFGPAPREDYAITFNQRPPRAHERWSESSPTQAERWRLNLEVALGLFYWTNKDTGLRLTTEQLAYQIATQLVKYHDTYATALGAKYPRTRF